MITPRRFAASCSPALLTLLISACSSPPAPPVPESLDELAKQSLAQIEGDLKVAGLKEPVEILRDRNGMPHIYAKNDSDMFFAQGYVMAQDRLWQLEMWRRWREGRLA
jgi:penicillin amidase